MQTIQLSMDDMLVDRVMSFLNQLPKNQLKIDIKPQETLPYATKDPKKHSRVLKREFDSDSVDEVALTHIKDSAKYIHELRRK
ncbi:MAG: hypothetical protein KU38_02355 [Sulfurovum sp. FS08-3]|nr:MAG: hypothetical protein KU38_02355 [Sulfurovum sp. FS08-3]